MASVEAYPQGQTTTAQPAKNAGMRGIPWQAKHQHGVFTAEQAVDAGWSECQLTRAVQCGGLVRLRRGAYAEPELEGWTGSLEFCK